MRAKQKDDVYVWETEVYYCQMCETHTDPNSKHCNQWNRWCIGFDHHWKWLNTCVGKRNYWIFFTLLLLLILLNIMNIILWTLAVIRHFSDPKSIRMKLKDLYSASSIIASCVILICVVIINLMILAAACNLLFFHFYLWKKGISTYEFIMMKRKKENVIIPDGSGDEGKGFLAWV